MGCRFWLLPLSGQCCLVCSAPCLKLLLALLLLPCRYGESSPEQRAADNPALHKECDGADFLQLGGLPAVDYPTLQMSDSYFAFVSA